VSVPRTVSANPPPMAVQEPRNQAPVFGAGSRMGQLWEGRGGGMGPASPLLDPPPKQLGYAEAEIRDLKGPIPASQKGSVSSPFF
jgi:hypothetical protein